MANIVPRRSTEPLTRSLWRDLDPIRSMLMTRDPFQEMSRIWPSEQTRTFVPDFDVRQTKDAYVFQADLPGIREQDLDINITGNRITISGKRELEDRDESDNYFCSERAFGSFTRSFTLPSDINADNVQAELKDGVLTLRVPKSAEAQPKRVQIKASQSGDTGGEKARA